MQNGSLPALVVILHVRVNVCQGLGQSIQILTFPSSLLLLFLGFPHHPPVALVAQGSSF